MIDKCLTIDLSAVGSDIPTQLGISRPTLTGLTKFHLLIVDEMGYLSFNSEGAHCFFNLISRRYEKSSTIFTSNKSYGEWGEIFGDHVIAAAVLDRILHHCTTLNIKGDSYRLKERRKQGVFAHSLPG